MQKSSLKVLFMLDSMDPVLMTVVREAHGKKLVSVESSEVYSCGGLVINDDRWKS